VITAEIFAPISRRQSADLEMDGIDFATLETCLYCSLLAGTRPALQLSMRDFLSTSRRANSGDCESKCERELGASRDLANVTLNAHTRPAQRPRSTNMDCCCNAGYLF
jgi:hypothetical protein